jgi:diamine N-acetyltransferase
MIAAPSPSPLPVSLVPVKVSEVGLVRAMAGRIWPLAYDGIIPASQIDYMLDLMYSEEALNEEIGVKNVGYRWIVVAGEKVGFLAAGPLTDDKVCPLHKFYLLPEAQGRGIGSAALAAFLLLAASAAVAALELRVNRQNTRAIALYRKAGFVISREDCLGIGGGFVMDDYVMQRHFPNRQP